MNTYPTRFEQKEIIPTLDDSLRTRGFIVKAGLEAADIEEIGRIARTDSVREFCPNDAVSRFGSVSHAEKWLAKGRGMFQLQQIGADRLAGYGWTGPEECPFIKDGETTFAVRLSPEFAGQGLAVPFTNAILLGSAALFGSKNIWLETWQSNQAAVRTYQKNGAVLIASMPSERATQTNDTGQRSDVRLFMKFGQTFTETLINGEN